MSATFDSTLSRMPPRMPHMAITAYTATTALGHGVPAQAHALQNETSGLGKCDFDTCALDCWTGAVAGLDDPLPAQLREWECRNNRLAYVGLHQDRFIDHVSRLSARRGADRIGVFMGTSTAGIHHTELAYRELDATARRLPSWYSHRHTQSSFSIAEFVAVALQLSGPTLTISTACSSSAKVFAAAYRSIHAGYCDAAVVGGVDSLCLTTLYGFNALQLVSSDVCRPADAARSGISIGEAAGFAILERDADSDVYLLGYGESSDAHHMSTPDPGGAGAAASMRAALARAGLKSADIGYVNLHGTGTQANDAAEDKAVCAVLSPDTPCSSTKGWTGHTLGAAGIVESVISLVCIANGVLPRSLNTRVKDPNLRANVLMTSARKPVSYAMSNSFGFGGSNCSLVFGARP